MKQKCECKTKIKLLDDAIAALETVLAGLERYRRNLPAYERLLLEKTLQGVPAAVCVIKQARKR